jgi:site-specific DNA recombinase
MKSAQAEGLTGLKRAAIYARKSTKDDDKGDELKSVDIQVASARRFAQEQGLRVLDEHIYVDDKVSGARIRRPRLDDLMRALGIEDKRVVRPGPLPFDVLIVRDQSRLIRNADHATRLIKRIVRSGVELWYYKEKRRVALGFSEELLTGVHGQIDSAQRINAGQDVREGLTDRALRGLNTGVLVYGYTPLQVKGMTASGQEKRIYTDFIKNEEEAEVVRRIFRMFVDGFGPRRIAKTLNGDPKYAAESLRYFGGARPPKPIMGKRGTGSWRRSSASVPRSRAGKRARAKLVPSVDSCRGIYSRGSCAVAAAARQSSRPSSLSVSARTVGGYPFTSATTAAIAARRPAPIRCA